MKKFLTLLIVLLCVATKVDAQFDVHYTHYWEMQNFYNPAAAGATGRLHAFAAYSNQFSGFENNPRSLLINADAPLTMLRGDHSAGLGVLNDEIGKFTNQHIYLNYAYGLKLFGGRLAAGAQVGILNIEFDPSGLIFGEDSNDPAFPTSAVNGNSITFGAGLLYRHKYFYTGVSAFHINAPLITVGEKNEYQVEPYYNFMAGGNIPLKNTLITLQPSLQLMTDFLAFRADITLKGSYKYNDKEFFGGVTYSPTTSVAFILGAKFLNFTVSYGYDLFTSGVGAANGSHDIFVGYSMDFDIFKKEKNKHNSIRVLQ